PSLRKVLGHPYGLNPQGERKGPDGQDQVTFKYDKDMGMWTAPFVMAGINTRIVRRSHALRGFPYGQDFRYSEVMSTGASTKGLARAVAITGALGGLLAGANIGPVRKQIEKRLPKPGEGPTKEQRENGFFVIRLLADGVKDGGAKVRLRGEVRGTKDPGYGETAKMLGESALCLAFDELPVEGGSWTPATAMGGILTDRLRAAGMTFAVKTSS
ncbi:MAG: saccharopine dehydrogenase, partial [Myxococcota bacterium]